VQEEIERFRPDLDGTTGTYHAPPNTPAMMPRSRPAPFERSAGRKHDTMTTALLTRDETRPLTATV
jgi:hypothetical protein